MRLSLKKVTTTIVLVGVMTAVPLGSAFATTTTQSAKVKVAKADYARTIAKARAEFRSAIKLSRGAAVAVGKPAELVRREKVKVALAAFNKVVATAKAPSFAAEKSYKAAILKLVASPNNVTWKADSKAALAALTKASAALKVDQNVAAARIVFAKARLQAMVEFKATIAKVVKERHVVQVRELAKFNAAKAKAAVTMKVALKAAQTGTVKTPVKKK